MTTMQEYMVTCGTGKIPARLPVDRTRIVPGPPPSAAPLPDAAELGAARSDELKAVARDRPVGSDKERARLHARD